MDPATIYAGFRIAKAALSGVIEKLRPETVAFRRNGVVLGEFPFAEACRMVQTGEIMLTDEYLHEGMTEYCPVSESNIAKRMGND